MTSEPRHGEGGSILILTLWIVTLLSLMACGVVARARLGFRAEAWVEAEVEGRELLNALAAYAVARLQQDQDSDVDSYQEPWGRVYEADSASLLTAFQGIDPGTGDFVICIRAADEYGKINVNLASEQLILDVLREGGVGVRASEVASAIVDWRDSDDTGFAESDLYAGLDPPYAPANVDLACTEELLFVYGVDPVMFFGEDANRNGTLDPNEDDGDVLWPPDNADGQLQLGLVDLFTVYGDGIINVNCAPEPVVRAIFHALLDDAAQANSLAAALLARRRGADGRDGTDDDRPFANDADLIACLNTELGDEASEVASRALQFFGVTSDVFRFYVSVNMPARHLFMASDIVVGREDTGLRVLEFHDL